MAIAQEVGEPVVGPEDFEDVWAVPGNVDDAHHNVEDEPDQDDGREEAPHELGAELLDQEQAGQDDDGDDHNPCCTITCISSYHHRMTTSSSYSPNMMHACDENLYYLPQDRNIMLNVMSSAPHLLSRRHCGCTLNTEGLTKRWYRAIYN